MPRIITNHEDHDALNTSEDMSDARLIYIDKHETVPLTIEMDAAEGWDNFNTLSRSVLPILPHSYEWVRVNNKYCIIKECGAKDHHLLLIIYGPDKVTHKINFLFRIDGKTTHSFAHTKDGKGPGNRPYPMSNSDYEVIGFDYTHRKYSAHVRGHLIDHQDTILNASTKDLWSTADARNYVPEPPDYEWGMGFRNQEVKTLRKQRGGSAYAQLNLYPAHPQLTRDGTPVPEDVKFVAYKIDAQKNYTVDEAFNIEFDEMLARPAGTKVLDYANSHFGIDTEACPVVCPYSPDTPDRELRLQARTQFAKIAKIESGSIQSRFKERDSLVASYQAADMEFETAGRRLSAGGLFSKAHNKNDSRAYSERSLDYADELLDLDDKDITPYQKSDIKVARKLFQDLDDDDLLDRFNCVLKTN